MVIYNPAGWAQINYTQLTPAQPEPTQSAPAQPERIRSERAQPDSAQPARAQRESVQPEPAKPESVQCEPAQPEGAQPQGAEAEPATSLSGQSVVAHPLLLLGEDPAAYDELRQKVLAVVTPADAIEEIFVDDVINLIWEAHRWRRLKAALMNERATHPPYRKDEDDLETYRRKLLKGDALMAETLVDNLDSIERIDHLAALAEARRIAALREIERHRSMLAQRLRDAVKQIEDAEVIKSRDTRPINPLHPDLYCNPKPAKRRSR